MRLWSFKMTLNDISKKAGVSVATVCRVSKNFPGVKSSTRKKVLAVLRETGYDTTALAELQSFSNQKKQIEILVCPLPEQHEPISMSYYVTVLEGIHSILNSDDFDLRININFLNENQEEKYFRDYLDGIILIGFPAISLVNRLEQGSIPYVMLSNNPVACWTEIVSVDKYQESFQLIEKLTVQGIRRVGLLVPKIDYNVLNGVIAGLRFRGLELADSDLGIAENTELASFVAPVQKLLAAPTLPEAMICINKTVFQFYQEVLRSCRPGDDAQMLYVFFSDYPQKNCAKAVHIQTDSFREGVLGAEWLISKIKRKRYTYIWRI